MTHCAIHLFVNNYKAQIKNTLVKYPHQLQCFKCKFNQQTVQIWLKKILLSYDVASGSEITPCNKIDKPLVVYRFTGSVMTSITTSRT